MECKRIVGSLLVLLMGLFCSSQAYQFYVGGRDGWVLKPSESYRHWAERNRFQVNDTLVFKYKKGSDSVLVVSKDDYNSCNTKNPKVSLTEGDSIFKFDHSGPFYFITGNADNCNKGQKLTIVVLAVRPKPSHQPPSASPSPSPSTSHSPSPSASSPAATPSASSSPSPASPPETETAPAPAPSGSVVLGYSVGLVAASAVFGSFVGMF